MKSWIFATALGLVTLVVAAHPSTARAAAHAAAQSGAASEAEIEASRAAVAAIDFDRLFQDREYAAQFLPHLDRLEPVFAEDVERRAALESVRLAVLTTLGRREEVATLLDRVLSRRSRDASDYAGPIHAALTTRDWPRAVAVVEAAAGNVPGVGWADLRELFDGETMSSVLGRLDTADQKPLQVRLAQSLFRIGWPGNGDAVRSDFLRSILVEDRMAQGDRPAAVDFASGVTTPVYVLPMIVQPRFDEVLAPGRDRLDLFRQVLAERDRITAEDVAASPQNHKRVLDRAQFLHGVARDAEALALLQPFLRDLEATVAASDEGLWLINEAAYVLIALDRGDEAVDLMARMAELPIDEYPGLISTRINYSEILWATGRSAEALAYATELERSSASYASDYGDMWIAASTACALAQLNRSAEAAPQLERLRAHSAVNAAALMQAYLCVGDLDSAEAFMVRRLQGEDTEEAILALQDYELATGMTQTGGVYDRLLALRERPAVRAALDRVGRVLTLPMARGYWGSF